MTPPPNFWSKRIPIPYNEVNWKYIPLENSALNKDGNIAHFNVYGLAFASANKVWIASDLELLKFENGHSKPIDMRSHLLSQGVNNVKIGMDGKIWIGYTSYGLPENWISSWDEKMDWRNYECPGEVIDFVIAKNGTIWVIFKDTKKTNPAFYQNSVAFYQDKTWHNVEIGNNSEGDYSILSMVATSDGSVWFDTQDKKYHKFFYRWVNGIWERHAPNFTNTITYNDFWVNPQNFMVETIDGTIWGSEGFYIYHFDGKNEELYYGSHFSQMGYGGLAVSKDGKIWAGDGFINDGKNYFFTDSPFYQVNTIQVAPDDTIWYGTDHGIYIYDNKEDS
jgi:ligand-binding sensor domain-containing protein